MWSLSFVRHIIFLRAMRKHSSAFAHTHTESLSLWLFLCVSLSYSLHIAVSFTRSLAKRPKWIRCASFEWNSHMETVICNSFLSMRTRAINGFGWCVRVRNPTHRLALAFDHHHYHPQSGQFLFTSDLHQSAIEFTLISFSIERVRWLSPSFR